MATVGTTDEIQYELQTKQEQSINAKCSDVDQYAVVASENNLVLRKGTQCLQMVQTHTRAHTECLRQLEQNLNS